jgi:hypothetical protein
MTFADEALRLAQLGLAVFPLQPRLKKPYGWSTGLHAATLDAELIAGRWSGRGVLPVKEVAEDAKDKPPPGLVIRPRPNSNIGIATGPISGVWVFDLDGQTAEDGLAALVAVHGPLPVTPEQITGGGRQLFFAWDDTWPLRNSASKIGPGIDVRGDGGYVVAPPSVHPGDEKKGIPPGRIYTWAQGRAPWDIPFAAAPEWLLKAAMPAPEAEHRPPSQPRTIIEGRATKYGEATLATTCARIAATPPGGQNEALFGYAAFIGARIAGNEIEHAYGRAALIDAGMRMAPRGKPWTLKDVEGTVDRGLDKGGLHPTSAPDRPTFQPAQRRAPRVEASAAERAVDIRSARQLWDAARPADCGLFRSWLRIHGLDAQGLPHAVGRLRAYQRAPIGDETGPAILVPLSSGLDDLPDALAILPLDPRNDGLTDFVGDPAGRVAVLVPWGAGGDVVVTTDFQDAWALGSSAVEAEHDMGVVIAPLRTTLSGAALGDRWGRVDPRTPFLDPDNPPWTAPGIGTAFIAVRGDLENPPLRSRKAWGGTARVDLQGEAAARFYGGLADQGWRKAGANQVRILRPSAGARGFNAGRSGRGA